MRSSHYDRQRRGEAQTETLRRLNSRLWAVLGDVARGALRMQAPDGSMPAGCNGPYNDASTSVRNTAHWASLFAALANHDGRQDYHEAARKCRCYLCSTEARPDGLLFRNRFNSLKDPWNGLIGQVWALEPLLAAGAQGRCSTVFSEVTGCLPFDESLGLWRLKSSPSHARLVLTLNQQVWTASLLARASIEAYPAYRPAVNSFLDALPRYAKVSDQGLLQQLISPVARQDLATSIVPVLDPRNIRPVHHLQALARQLRWQRRIDLGYHAFTLFGLARLKESVPAHPSWREPFLQPALEACADQAFLISNLDNPFGSGYHLVGIEAAYAMWELGWGTPEEREAVVTEYVLHDLSLGYDSRKTQVSRNTSDPATITARLYEAIPITEQLESSIEELS